METKRQQARSTSHRNLSALVAALAAALGATPAAAGPIAGFGTARLPDSGFYRGWFRDGRFQGRGSLVWRDGSRYEGAFAAGLMQGLGSWRSRIGETYRGSYHGGVPHGAGVSRHADGAVYAGGFVDGLRDGHGRYATVDGDVYRGRFRAGEFEGHGHFADSAGLRYRGEFRAWRFWGHGEYRWDNGDRYVGGFRDGQFHGSGVMYYATAQDGRTRLAGHWQDGEFVAEHAAAAPAAAAEQLRVDAEALLFAQPARLAEALAAIDSRASRSPRVFFVGFAGDGHSDVFMNEVRYAQRVVAERFGSAGRSLLLVNNPGTRGSAPLATATNLRHALAGLARHMDPRTDILFLYLASHGSDDFRLAVRLGDAPINDLGAPELARILAQMPVRRKVVVISACYAGGFIDHLRGPETLVIAAARHDRVSFGCEPDNELTFFGRAFLQDALAHEADIVAAFARATRAVRTLEARRHFEHSEPQIAGGQALRAHLAAIAAGVPATP